MMGSSGRSALDALVESFRAIALPDRCSRTSSYSPHGKPTSAAVSVETLRVVNTVLT
jgi:hypothetical protein